MNRLSIITINLNNLAGLAETFSSVFSQRFSGFEYIVIDGGSTDGSVELMNQHAEQINYRVSEKDKGLYDAMNKGIAAARGEYLLFLNSGDALVDEHSLEQCMQHLLRHPEADILYADYYSISGQEAAPERYRYPPHFTLDELKKHIPCQQASLVKAQIFKEIGVFPLDYWIAADYWMYLKSFLAGKKFLYMDFVMARYHAHGLSAIHSEACFAEMAAIWQKLVPETLRRPIDKKAAFRKSRWGMLWMRTLARLGLQSS